MLKTRNIIFNSFILLGFSTLFNGFGDCQTEGDYRPIQSRNEDQLLRENRNGFYPSFPPFQPSGHSRPFYQEQQQQQEAAYSHRPQGAYEQRFDYDSAKYTGYKDQPIRTSASENLGVLGSGNFGVIKGGTFYQGGGNSNYDDDSFYQNGHGRPSFYYNQNPRPYQHDQFENFRDFADINTPSYSQYIVVYANKNGSNESVMKRRPNNIFEQLELSSDNDDIPTTFSTPPVKKLSKSKRKLATLPKEKKIRMKKTAQTEKMLKTNEMEPLLALS